MAWPASWKNTFPRNPAKAIEPAEALPAVMRATHPGHAVFLVLLTFSPGFVCVLPIIVQYTDMPRFNIA